jgi:hypothetical protein
MKYAKYSLLIYLLLKPFYLFSSGGLQIGDVFLILAFVIMLISLKFNPDTRKKLLHIVNDNKHFVIFTFLALMINVLYFIGQTQFQFLLSTLYFIFILMAIVLFSFFFKDRSFLAKVSKVFKFNLAIQLGIFLLGIGKFYDPTRYMGTFNDPNQFGYYILISFFFIYAIRVLLNTKDRIVPYFLITLFLIVLSASTGMLLGLGVFLTLSLMRKIKNIAQLPYQSVRKVVYSIVTVCVIVAFILLPLIGMTSNNNNPVRDAINNQIIVERLTQKVSQSGGSQDSGLSFWEDRGYDKIIEYPVYTLFGAGQGAYDRFKLAATDLEIHATFPSILFYYGIVPFSILMWWVYSRVKDSHPELLIMYVALLAESLTLSNQRQTLFWMIIVLGSLYSKKAFDDNTAHQSTVEVKA